MNEKSAKNVLIAGGSGFIGSALANHLTKEGYTVSILSRGKSSRIYKTYNWNPYKNEIDLEAITNNEYIINLTGAGIADKYWSNKRKQELVDSRVLSTRLLVDTVIEHNPQLRTFISTSATGFYGHRPGEILDEKSEVGDGFLAGLCQLWENETKPLTQNNISTTILRIGIVLSKSKGFIQKLHPQFRMGLNVVFGSGSQKTSWIHIDDLTNIFQFCIEDLSNNEVLNAVAPESINIYELQKTIARNFGRKTIDIRINSKLIKGLLGDFSEIFFSDLAVKPERLLDKGFHFRFNTIESALPALLGKEKAGEIKSPA